MKEAILITNPLLGIINPKRARKGSKIKKEVIKMARHKGSHKKGVHRPEVIGTPGHYYIPKKSKLFAQHAGEVVHWNPRHHRYHRNPASAVLEDAGLLLVGVAGGIWGVQAIPNLLKRMNWFQTHSTIADIGGVLLTAGIGAGLTFGVKSTKVKEIGMGLMATPVAMYVFKEIGAKAPSVFLPASTTVPAVASTATSSVQGIESVGDLENVVPIRGLGVQTLV